MPRDDPDLAAWRRCFSTILTPWSGPISLLMELEEHLTAALNWVKTLSKKSEQDERHGVAVARMAMKDADRIFEHCGMGLDEAEPPPPRNLAQAQLVLKNLLATARNEIRTRWLVARPPDREGETEVPGTTPPADSEKVRVVLQGPGKPPIVKGKKKRVLTDPQDDVVQALLEAGEGGLTKDELEDKSGHSDARGILRRLAKSDPDWGVVIHFPGRTGGRYRIW
jgi:hypothetical protein